MSTAEWWWNLIDAPVGRLGAPAGGTVERDTNKIQAHIEKLAGSSPRPMCRGARNATAPETYRRNVSYAGSKFLFVQGRAIKSIL